jgi:hypothetical protein
MQDRSDRVASPQENCRQNHVAPAAPSSKRIGSYLVEAGLLTMDQISVILNDQQATGMRFGDIVVARGWVKEKTIEWIVTKVVEPERHALKQRVQRSDIAQSLQPLQPHSLQPVKAGAGNSFKGKPLPSVPQPQSPSVAASANAANNKAFNRREAPISKPLPSVSSSDGDVNWVG